MIKQETLPSDKSKEMYIKPVCDVYETEPEGILCGSKYDTPNVGTTEVNSFLPGREYETSVF